MRTTLMIVIAILTTCCNINSQSISKYLRVNGDRLEFDSTKYGDYTPIATEGWVRNHVLGYAGGDGETPVSYIAGNGLTLSGNQFTLGGAMTGTTTLTGVHNFNLGTSVSRINQFNVYGTSGVLLQDNAVSGTNPTLQLSSGNFQLYGRAGTVLATQNLSITSGGVTSITGGGLVFNPTDSISININSVAVSYDTTNDKPLVIDRNGRIKQGFFNNRTPSQSDYSAYYVSLSGSYANPSWITSIPVSKITFAGTSSQQLLGDGTLATRITNNNQLTNGAGYITNITGKLSAGQNITLTGSGTTGDPYVINAAGGQGGTVDAIPTNGSANAVSSDGVFDALSLKEGFISVGTTAQVWRGDKTWLTLNTANVPESGNLYYTDARARAAISLTTTGTSGAATFINGVLNIPNYATGSGVALTNFSAVAPLTYNNATGEYSTSISTSRLVGRTTSGTGVMEQISVGSQLSLSAGVLNVAAVGKTLQVASSGKPYTSVQAAVAAASSGDLVYVYPGTYNEAITLKNGVNIHLSQGASIESSGSPAFSDGGVAVNATIWGYGTIKQTSTGFSRTIEISNASSNVSVYAKLIQNASTSLDVVGNLGTIYLYFDDVIGASGGLVNGYTGPGQAVMRWKGRVTAGNDYGVRNSGGGTMIGEGDVTSVSNSAVSCYSGNLRYSGFASSAGLYGLEIGGGVVTVHDAIIQSTKNNATEGSAISKYGGDTLYLDGVTLLCANTSAKAIESQNISSHGQILVRRSSYANTAIQASPALNILFGRENLLVATSYSAHAPLDLAGKIPAANLPTSLVYDNEALNLNGNTIENYSAKYNDQTGTSYTLLSSDNGKVVTFNNASAITVTVPSGLPVGFNCMILQKGAGQVTLSASSTTINNRQSLTKTAGQWAVASLISTSSNVFVSGGDMAN